MAIDFQALIAKMKEKSVEPVDGQYTMIVHPLTWLLECRGVGGICIPIRTKHFQEIYDQTFADYYGWGINGCEG